MAERILHMEVLQNVMLCTEKYSDKILIFGGDLNADFDEQNPTSNLVNQFAMDNELVRCDNLFTGPYLRFLALTVTVTSLKCQRNIDFILSNAICPMSLPSITCLIR